MNLLTCNAQVRQALLNCKYIKFSIQIPRPNLTSQLLAIITLIASTYVFAASPHPNMYVNQDVINGIKSKVSANVQPWSSAYSSVMAAANSALNKSPLSVTYQGKTTNQYYTEKPYCGWPDGCRDGEINPNADRGDYEAAIQLGDAVRDLGLGYAFTGQAKYADKAIDLIRVWSLNPDTAMTPSTAATNRIELFITLPGYFYGADLIWNYSGWDAGEKTAFANWVKAVGDHGMANGAGLNNFANWRVVLIASAGALLDDNTLLNYAATEWKRLIPLQITGSGILSLEYSRTKGLHYSLYALNAMIQAAEILRHRNINVYDYVNSAKSMELALDFITPYAINPSSWPYEQITTITQNDSMALYELAYSYYQKQSYLDAINRWGRPLNDIRVMGITTLTHANLFDLWSSPPPDSGIVVQDFETYSPGEDPLNWRDSAANNSLLEDNSEFEVFTLASDKVFGTTSTATNIHSHYNDGSLDGLSGYKFSGRFMFNSSNGGVGVTFFSQYPARDAYYRLRRYGNKRTFHLSPHGTVVSGDYDTGVSSIPNQWYRFRIEVKDTGTQTEIRARVWLDGGIEPLSWQVTAYDNSTMRLTAGSIGVWSYQGGNKYWDDLVVEPLASTPTLFVPYVGGLTQLDAETSINAVGLTVGTVSSVYNDTLPAEYVVSQDPPAGTSVPVASLVDLVVSLGPLVMVNIPDVVGLFQAEAESSITAAGLTVGTISGSYSNTLPPGSVIDQNPAPGSLVSQASSVDLVVSSGTSIILQDFETYSVGANPLDWRDSGANNSLLEDNSLFEVFTVDSNKVFGTASAAVNIHSHFNDGSLDALTGYEYNGRFMISSSKSGIGVTFFSQYPNRDAYYRLRRFGNNPTFHLSSHGTSVSGDIDTGVIPLPNLWYRFRIEVEDTGTQTEIRARVWLAGNSEPLFWQVQAYDSSPSRLTSGNVGIWSYRDGSKYWDNLLVVPLVSAP